MTRVTGWLGNDEPDAQRPAMPLADQMLAMRQRGPGDTLAMALARARADEIREERAAAAAATDPDEHAAGLIGRGYMPGQLSQLTLQLADVTAELEAEREKIERGERRQEHVMRAHRNGQLRAWDIPAALGDDLGDEGRVRLLERRAESLRRQIGEAHEAISPPSRRGPDPLEAAASRAHQVFAELTRQRMAEAEARRPEPRPFASRAGLPAADAECTGPDCPVCAWGRERDAERSAEADRLMALGYSRETAEYAATPAGAEVYR